MSDLGHNKNHRNCDEFGGIPFLNHMGNRCHRGATAFKKSEFHPMDTAKRVIYRNDGTGRDGYIAANSGGLTTNKHNPVQGSDVGANYARGLRGYGKDNVSPGYHRLSTPLRIAEYFIEKSLKPEEADNSGKFTRRHNPHLVPYQGLPDKSAHKSGAKVAESLDARQGFNTI
jgi:hypothetical protein